MIHEQKRKVEKEGANFKASLKQVVAELRVYITQPHGKNRGHEQNR